MTEKQKQIFAKFWAENRGDVEQEIQFVLASRTQQRNIVKNWWGKKKANLEQSKATLTQEFIDQEKAKIDAEIADGEDLATNF